MSRAEVLIVDRDHTINLVPKAQRYTFGSDPIEIYEDALRGLKLASCHGIRIFGASNQQGIARKDYPEISSESVHEYNIRLTRTLQDYGIDLEYLIFCPHIASAKCNCRKPRPGQIFDIMRISGATPSDILFVGDSSTDVEAASMADVSWALVDRDRSSNPLNGTFDGLDSAVRHWLMSSDHLSDADHTGRM